MIDEQVAVIGYAGRFPGARSADELWANVLAGRESLTRFTLAEVGAAGVDPAEFANPRYVPVRGVLDDVESFDADLFGYAPQEAGIIDPQQRILLECAREALEHAGYGAGGIRAGVFAGASLNTYLLRHLLGSPDRHRALELLPIVLGNEKDHVATRIAYKLGLTGPAVAVQTGCSTSLVAVHLAVQSLLRGECDSAVAGGATIHLPQRSGYVFQRDGITSPDGHCRAFAADAAGTVPGNGAALVVLKRAGDALRDGNTVHALILGSAINNDGAAKVGYTAPSAIGQAEVVRSALRAAEVDAATIGYVETHGTGTELGDGVEVAALTEAFRAWTDRTGYCAIGSLKPNIGHLDVASGVAGLVKAVLSLSRGTIPPSIHCAEPNPALRLGTTPFYVNTEARPWDRAGAWPPRAGVSSFGMGGTNAHVVLEAAPVVADRAPEPGRPVLVVQSARTRDAVETLGRQLVTHVDAAPDISLVDAATTLQVGRGRLGWRRAATVADHDELSRRWPHVPVQEVPRTVTPVFLFPGQGAQYAGMAAGLYADFADFAATVDTCFDLLGPRLGAELRSLLCHSALDRADEADAVLASTRLSQPALFVVEYALARLLMGWGMRPKALIGHSVGEYVAACIGGAVGLQDALRLVVARGRLMNRAPSGGMLVVSADEHTVLDRLDGALSVAAVNAPEVVVVAGARDELAAVAARFAADGVRTRWLRVSHAFHSAAMDPVLDEFLARAAEADYGRLAIPVVSNVTGDFLDRRAPYSADYWTRHLREPVRFSAGLSRVLALPAPVLIEVGPGRSLSSLVRAHPGSAAVVSTMTAGRTSAPGSYRALLDAVGVAWCAGAPVNWEAFNTACGRGRRIPLPTYPFARTRCWPDEPSTDTPWDRPPSRPDARTWTPDDIQDGLAEIWRRLLGVGTLTPADDFFELGGHSLLAVPLLTGVEETFDVAISLREVQEATTLRAQAELVATRLPGSEAHR